MAGLPDIEKNLRAGILHYNREGLYASTEDLVAYMGEGLSRVEIEQALANLARTGFVERTDFQTIEGSEGKFYWYLAFIDESKLENKS